MMRLSSHAFVRLAPLALALLLVARTVSTAILPLTDATEGRYAQVAQEMAVTGDWVTPRVWMNETHLPFLGKPPLFFWASAGAIKIFWQNEFAARLPSVLAAVALLGLLYSVMGRYGGAGSGLLSVLLTASCGFFAAVAGSVSVDMLFSACVAGSLLAYFAFISETDRLIRRRWSLLVFVLLALGFLTKGPVAVVLFGLPVLVWTMRWRGWPRLREHRWLAGTLLFLVLVVPWFLLCEVRNPGFIKYFFVNENLLRFVTHDYGDAYGSGHLYPRGSALLMFVVAAAPWSLFGLWLVFSRWRAIKDVCQANRQAGFLFLSFAAGILF
ncbi:MAG: glycosyltransferase family 39 protein, partial [Kiritimatiellae bacterium]|nr:glycosyltransferase family 39 protein [Kiritimatiellia bacterium]